MAEAERLIVEGGKVAACLLLFFEVFVEFKPSEPFLVQFLHSKGIESPVEQLFSLYIYFNVPVNLLVGLFSAWLGGAVLLVVGSLFGLATVAITLFSSNLLLLQVSQFTASVALAVNSSALYDVVARLTVLAGGDYQRSVHRIMAALAFSTGLAGVVGTGMRRVLKLDYAQLWKVTLCCQVVAACLAADILRRVYRLSAQAAVLRERVAAAGGTSTVNQMPLEVGNVGVGMAATRRGSGACCKEHSVGKIFVDIARCLALAGVLEWTLWSLVAQTTEVMVQTMWQAVVKDINDGMQDFNGLASSATHVVAGVTLLLLAEEPMLARRRYRRLLIIGSLCCYGALQICIGFATSSIQVYVSFVCYYCLYRLGAACATQQVIAEISEDPCEDREAGAAPRCSEQDTQTMVETPEVGFQIRQPLRSKVIAEISEDPCEERGAGAAPRCSEEDTQVETPEVGFQIRQPLRSKVGRLAEPRVAMLLSGTLVCAAILQTIVQRIMDSWHVSIHDRFKLLGVASLAALCPLCVVFFAPCICRCFRCRRNRASISGPELRVCDRPRR
eukprot:TRINITY_DN5592_c0_g1_i3.p1 TRINITY_DN5592_c0_g1~~TRINITY_DN5592_c0_g1_i3.p1  ORF type:complete len:573 (+),score=88.81 TRINITY_DN5592_c0_g1_i3:48-1721(+)